MKLDGEGRRKKTSGSDEMSRSRSQRELALRQSRLNRKAVFNYFLRSGRVLCRLLIISSRSPPRAIKIFLNLVEARDEKNS